MHELGRNGDVLLRARDLVLRYGWNATAYQILNPGISYWFSARGDAVVGFVARHHVRVVAGAPVCERHRLPAVSAEFEEAARGAGERVCYFGAGERLESVYSTRRSHSMIALGAQPSWDPRGWTRIIAVRASVRAQLHRAHNKGVTVE
jgi:phosphatidylglycerol lysyltransferase